MLEICGKMLNICGKILEFYGVLIDFQMFKWFLEKNSWKTVVVENEEITNMYISEIPGSRKGHPEIWKGPIAYHAFAQK